ncbi:MAG TPA: hypothetical protein VH540_05280, partial [Ktedonobacterales bacterium]
GTVQSAHARPGRLSASAAIVLIPGAYRQTAACSPGVPAGRPGAGSGACVTVRFRMLCSGEESKGGMVRENSIHSARSCDFQGWVDGVARAY